jgi:hypothetical protein
MPFKKLWLALSAFIVGSGPQAEFIDQQKPEIQKYFALYPKALPAFEAALSHEKKLKEDGSLTLYHSCKKEIYAMTYLDTKLMELIHGKRPDYLKLRQPFGSYNPTKNPVQIRTHFLKHGTSNNNNPYERYHLLSANHELMGNLLNATSSTAYLFAKNNNRSCPAFDAKKIFEQYRLSPYYERYKTALTDALEIEMEGGVLLQLAFTPNLIDKTVYPAHAGGPKIKVVLEGKSEDRPSLILDAITQKPFSGMLDYSEALRKLRLCVIFSLDYSRSLHKLQWRVILTNDILLNPNSPEVLRGDFKVFTYSMEPETLAEFHRKIDDIVAQIHQDMLSDAIH